ncbi:hypothetical protein M0R36_10610 [bacterium]|jgi:hypothetical protein|nr:hypothetical protein [bacterium]
MEVKFNLEIRRTKYDDDPGDSLRSCIIRDLREVIENLETGKDEEIIRDDFGEYLGHYQLNFY